MNPKAVPKVGASFALGLLALGASGCLPSDSGPPPGSVLVTASGDELSPEGFATDDDWQIQYDLVLISMGNVNQGCETSSGGRYLRVLDLLVPGTQKLALVYARGENCPFFFDVQSPPKNAVLGAGVSEADKSLMRTAGSDKYIQNQGVVFHVAGSATRAGTSLEFAWSFRENLWYENCFQLDIESETSQTLDIRVRTSALFDEPSDASGAVTSAFDPFAAADGDGDGEITLGELESVTFPNDPVYPTLGARLYRQTVPLLIHVGDRGSCPPGSFTSK